MLLTSSTLLPAHWPFEAAQHMDSSQSTRCTIYALIDPTTAAVRYVGKTTDPMRRFKTHVREAQRGHRCYRCAWIRSIGMPVFKPLVVVSHVDGPDVERRIIALYRARGYRLTNATDGGDGNVGWNPSPETRAAIKASWTAERRAAQIARQLGRTLPANHRENMRRAMTPERRAALSQERLGHHVSAEARAKMSASRRGQPSPKKGRKTGKPAWNRGTAMSQAQRERMRSSAVKRFQDPAERARLSAANRGQVSPNKGKAMSQAQKEKLRAAWRSPDAKAKLSAALREAWKRRLARAKSA